MNKLIVDVKEPLKCLEAMPDKSYQMIYMEPPFNLGRKDWVFSNGSDPDENDRQYGEYISKLVENTERLLLDDGILCFSIISSMNNNYNYQMILEHFFKSILPITLNDRRKLFNRGLSSHSIIYCCSKTDNYEFPDLKEPADIQAFPFVDEHGRAYSKSLATRKTLNKRAKLCYSWHGIYPSDGRSWIYRQEKMDSEYDKGNILIEGAKVFLKKYQDETFVPVGTVWDNDTYNSAVSERNMMRLISMFSDEGQHVLCPFERDGMFSYCASKANRQWTSLDIHYAYRPVHIEKISEDDYERVSAEEQERFIEYEQVIKSRNEVNELTRKIVKLQDSIRKIQADLGVDPEDEEEIDLVIEKIHCKIEDTLSHQNLDDYISEVKEWLSPYWDGLEDESKQLLPMGALLMNQLDRIEGADYAPALIEYCRTLEKELFEKFFRSYICYLKEQDVDVSKEFADSFCGESREFAKFVNNCLNRYPDQPKRWRFELGKMAFVLTKVLENEQADSLFGDFRQFLDHAFDEQFFGEDFAYKLSKLAILRNSCAHPSVVKEEDVLTGREMIRQKLKSILAYYN